MRMKRSVVLSLGIAGLVFALLVGVELNGTLLGAAAADTAVFINEIHYDNTGTDANEAIEVAGPAGTDLSGWSLVLYNGNGGASYNTTALSGVIPDQQNGFGTVNFLYPVNGIQNGSPDGVALVNASSVVVQFLSYEGSFTAADGPATGMTSTDIGVAEAGTEPVGLSLQLIGSGNVYEDFAWTGPIANTYDAVNTGQNFQPIGLSLSISKSAPGSVATGMVYTYTIFATNTTTDTLTNLVVTDTIPTANATLAEIMDGGVQVGGTISWTAGTLPPGEGVEVRFAMTATGAAATTILNNNYAVWADESPVPVRGPAVETTVTAGCDPGDTLISGVQGSGDYSPLEGTDVQICGVVIGVSPSLSGFFLQDAGDGDPDTSDGIFVYRGSQPFLSLQVGDLVEVFGEADEYYGVTQLRASGSGDALSVMAEDQPLPAAESLNPPAERAAADLYLETLEGMLTQIPVTVTVVGPTNYYGEYYFVRGDTGVTRIVRNTNPPDGYRLGVDDGITLSDDYIVGDVLSGLYGPLHYTYDEWKIEQWVQPTVVSLADVPETLPQYPPAEMYGVTMGAFNTLNFDGADDPVKLTKVVSAIISMGPPTFLSLEEIAVVDTTVTGILTEVLDALEMQGHHYDYAYSHADVGGHGVVVLYDTDVVQLDGVDTLQGCSSVGSSSSDYDPLWATCQVAGEYPLFSRRPVVVTGTLASTVPPTQITFIGAHLKSGFDSAADIQRRLEQAQLVAAYTDDLVDAGQPNVVLAGDLNDFLDSQTLTALEASGTLTNTYYTLPPEARYSYIYYGGSQVLDHVLVSQALFARLTDFQPLHIDADYPAGWEIDPDYAQGVSDHDPVVATFALDEPAVMTIDKAIVGRSGAGEGTLLYGGGMVTYTITLSNTSDVDALDVELEDVLPVQVLFDAWVANDAGAVETGNTITWTGTISAHTQVVLTFRATVLPYEDSVLLPVVNTATFTAYNAQGGEDSATFDLGVWQKIYMPMVMRGYTP